MFGFLNVNKSAGRTSHDVVARARRLLKIKQIGHAGTLDPAATGVLPLGIGSACRLLRFLPHDKTYVAEILFGRTTSTDDIGGETLSTADEVPRQCDEILAHLDVFRGEIEQVPPMVSAIHVGGERLYKLAREGRAPEVVPSRQVTVYSIEFICYNAPVLCLRIHCSGGTYIRSIARDLGQRLGCGGCLSSLIREQAGRFLLKDAIDIDLFNDLTSTPLLRPEDVLTLPAVSLDAEGADRIRKGQRVQAPSTGLLAEGNRLTGDSYVMTLLNGDLIAICKEESGELVPEVVINR